MERLLKKFDNDFREYLEASIAFAEIQDPYRPLSSEDEIKWLKEWIKNNCKEKI